MTQTQAGGRLDASAVAASKGGQGSDAGISMQAAPENLSGLIERVTFFNEENGFAVLKVRVNGHREPATVVGSLPSVSAGEWLIAEGRWVRDREFGLQFRAEQLKSTAPTSRE